PIWAAVVLAQAAVIAAWQPGSWAQSGSSQSMAPSRSLSRPSSQTSGASVRQSAPQPSPGLKLPSSHCSPGSTMPLPQNSTTQAEQPSPGLKLPSSHSSTPASTMPSPQRALRQVPRQASLSSPLPSSHCSPGSTTPLPQKLSGTRDAKKSEQL